MGRETDAVDFFSALAAKPYRYDFYQTLRRLDCLYGDKPRWGLALRPTDEPVRRMGQLLQALLAHAEAPVQLRLVITQATAPNPQYRSIRDYSDALGFFERPERSTVGSTPMLVTEGWARPSIVAVVA